MKKTVITITALFSCVISGTYAQQAQISNGKQTSVLQKQAPLSDTDDEWRIALTPYAWVPGMDLNVNVPVSLKGHQFDANLSMNADWTKVLSHYGPGFRLFAADGRMEVSKGKWGGFIDGYWIGIKVTGGSNGTKVGAAGHESVSYGTSITNKTQFGQVNFGPRYLIGSVPLNKEGDIAVGFEVYGGGRVNYLSNSLDASATVGVDSGSINTNSSRAFVEPMIGLKTLWRFGPNFAGIIRGDVGGFNVVDNNTDCDLEAGIAWQFHKNTYLDLAYRARGQWQTESSNNVTVRGWFHGPEIGMTFNF